MVTAALVSSSGVVGVAATVRRMTMKRQSKSNGMHQHHTVLHPHPKHIPDSQPHHHLNRMDPLLMLHRVPLPLPTTPLLILNHNPQPLSHLRLLPRDTTILQHIQVRWVRPTVLLPHLQPMVHPPLAIIIPPPTPHLPMRSIMEVLVNTHLPLLVPTSPVLNVALHCTSHLVNHSHDAQDVRRHSHATSALQHSCHSRVNNKVLR